MHYGYCFVKLNILWSYTSTAAVVCTCTSTVTYVLLHVSILKVIPTTSIFL